MIVLYGLSLIMVRRYGALLSTHVLTQCIIGHVGFSWALENILQMLLSTETWRRFQLLFVSGKRLADYGLDLYTWIIPD